MGRGGWVGAVRTFWYECSSVVLACESLHVCTVCIWRCEHAMFCVEFFLCAIYKKLSFIHVPKVVHSDVPRVVHSDVPRVVHSDVPRVVYSDVPRVVPGYYIAMDVPGLYTAMYPGLYTAMYPELYPGSR